MRADLVIGIGNPLRGDDGVAALLLEELEREREEVPGGAGCAGHPAAVVCQTVHQLTPDLALVVAQAGRVLFVDAWANPTSSAPWIQPLLPRDHHVDAPERACLGSHGLDPLTLLALAEGLYGWRGEGALLRVPARAFPHGCGFSAALVRVLPEARQRLRQWLANGG